MVGTKFYFELLDKNMMLSLYVSLEGIFNNLAMRLSQHKRNPFVPGINNLFYQSNLQILEAV